MENGKPDEAKTEQIRKLVRRILTDCVDLTVEQPGHQPDASALH